MPTIAPTVPTGKPSLAGPDAVLFPIAVPFDGDVMVVDDVVVHIDPGEPMNISWLIAVESTQAVPQSVCVKDGAL